MSSRLLITKQQAGGAQQLDYKYEDWFCFGCFQQLFLVQLCSVVL